MTRFEFVYCGSDLLAVSVDLPVDICDTNAAVPVVVVIHGLTGQRLGKSYHLVEFGRRLAAEGIACVRFDQRGCGESTGRFQDLTLPRMAEDAVSIRDWLADQPWADTTRMGYVGLSLGALPTVATDAAYGSQGIALWAPVYDMPRVFSMTAKTGLRGILDGQGWIPYRGLRIGKEFVQHIGAIDTPALLAQGMSPLRVFHSKADQVVDFAESQSYVDRCLETNRLCELIPFATADHDFGEYPDRQLLLDKTIEFFRNRFTQVD